jgi:hypothetical protein
MSSKEENYAKIIEALEAFPDSTSKEVHSFLPDVPFPTLACYIHELRKEGKLKCTGTKQVTGVRGIVRPVYTYAIAAPGEKGDDVRSYNSKSKPAQTPTAGYEVLIETLRGQIKELSQWKIDALERYPDLAVAPIVLKARAIVAEEFRAAGDTHVADMVMRGRQDATLAMRVTIKALEEAQ